MPCIDLKLTNPLARAAIESRLKKITRINSDLRERLRKQIRLGFEKGESIDQIADRLQKTFRAERGRALTIARTEINAAASDGLHAQAKQQFGENYDSEWITARDDRVRDSHYEVDGQRRAAGEEFSNGLAYPHEPGAPPEEVINCRCTVLLLPHEEE